ncbi:MAG: CRISPR-associated endonuclease Cas1 [Nitrososphaerales archaeon]
MVKLFITEFGVKLSRKKERFIIKTKENKIEIPSKDLEFINILSPACLITSPALRLIIKNSINMVISNHKGTPLAMLLPSKLSGTVKSRREQYLALKDERGLMLAKSFVTGKIHNQATLLKTLAKSRIRSNEEIGRNILNQGYRIESNLVKVNQVNGELNNARTELMNIEAEAAKLYWDAVKLIIPPEFNFTMRVKPSAKDPLNCILNFSYKALLFPEVWRAIIYAGLDPYAGFLHSDRSGRAGLVLDLMEEFRQQCVDRLILDLIAKKKILAKDALEDGRLKKEYLKLLIKSYEEHINNEVYYNDAKEKLSNVIISQARSIARFLNGLENYKPFKILW